MSEIKMKTNEITVKNEIKRMVKLNKIKKII